MRCLAAQFRLSETGGRMLLGIFRFRKIHNQILEELHFLLNCCAMLRWKNYPKDSTEEVNIFPCPFQQKVYIQGRSWSSLDATWGVLCFFFYSFFEGLCCIPPPRWKHLFWIGCFRDKVVDFQLTSKNRGFWMTDCCSLFEDFYNSIIIKENQEPHEECVQGENNFCKQKKYISGLLVFSICNYMQYYCLIPIYLFEISLCFHLLTSFQFWCMDFFSICDFFWYF